MSPIHHVPGRFRVRVDGVKGSPSNARSIEKSLMGMHGILGATGNPVTGSVVVHYDPKCTDLSSVLEALSKQESACLCLTVRVVRSRAKHPGTVRQRVAGTITHAVVWFLVEEAIKRSLAALI